MATPRAVERIERRCAAAEDERALRIELLEELRRLVPFGAHVWALLDPETTVGTAPVATVPDRLMAVLPRIVGLRYLTSVNRWTTLAGPAESLRRATADRPEDSLLYREVLGPAGVLDLATVVFADGVARWSYLELWRFEGDRPFAPEELEVLAATVPPITAALRRCLARSFADPPPTLGRTGPAVLVLSPELEVRAQTPETDAYLRALLPPDEDRRPIPAGAYNVGGQLLAVEAGVDDHPPVARVRLGGGAWLTFRAARVETEPPSAGGDIAVTIEPTSPGDRLVLYARSHGLSTRETEVLELLVGGADTRTVASRLFISEHTVQDHLKSIFDKTGVRNRRTLLTRVTGR